jgi:predicted acylesterase/phospholipase RssA/CRP-like cAMP-binding protein
MFEGNETCSCSSDVVQTDPHQLDSSEPLLRLLASRPVFLGLEPAILRDLAAALDSVHVRGGERIVASGQTGAPLVLVVHGGLRASFVDAEGVRHTTYECFRGGTIGEALLLSECGAPFDLHAIRDSHLLCLTPVRFNEVVSKHPELALRFARKLAARVVDLYRTTEIMSEFARQTDRLPRSIVLFSVGGPDVRRMQDLLARALTRSCRTSRLSSLEAHRLLQTDLDAAGPHGEARLAEWLWRNEERSDVVVFESEASDGSWLDFGLRQADRVMVLAQAGMDRHALEQEVWQKADLRNRSARVELAFVHPRSTSVPHGAAAYLDLPGLARLHHVRSDDQGDAARLARWLVDRPIGLVLGGGGAFGIAHVGVLKALEEFRVPVDVIGGTSMGAIFAGGRARGWSADAIMEQVRILFSSRFALYDPTIPVQALLAGKKLDRILRQFFEDIDFADLWTPFFCISTNISSARCEIHSAGDVWSAIRSSCSIPGLFPPFAALRRLLVDGGLVNNLPLDIMAERCHGPIIAVDVFPYWSSDHHKPRPATGLLRYLRPAFMGPRLFDILMHATFAGSEFRTERSLSSHPPALYLTPSTAGFRILDWRAYEGLYRAGYDVAKQELESGKLPRTLWEGPIEESMA